MRRPNFSKLSTEVLKQYHTEITEILDERELYAEKKNQVMSQIREIVEKEGLSLDKLFSNDGKKGGKRSGKKSEPKYRNPDNSNETWTGFGRKPGWVNSHLDAGGNLEDLAI